MRTARTQEWSVPLLLCPLQVTTGSCQEESEEPGPRSGSVPLLAVSAPKRDNGKLKKESEDCQDPGVVPFRCSCVSSKT